MFTIRHTHGSGRFDRSPALLEADLDAWAGDSNLITVTEVTQSSRAKRLAEKGWAVYRAESANKNAANVAVCFASSDWTLLHGEAPIVTEERYWTKSGNLRDSMAAAFAVLENPKTGKRLLVSVAHLPSSVAGDEEDPAAPGFAIWSALTRRVLVHAQSTRGIRRHQKRLMREWKCDGKMFVADWNLDIKRALVRLYVQVAFPRMSLTWQPPFPERGTHGKRIIDLALIGKGGLRVVQQPTLRQHTRASDHTAFRQVLAFL